MSRRKRAWKWIDRFLDRWMWLGAALFAIAAAARGDAIAAGFWGLLAGLKLQQRFQSDPPRNEVRIGMSKVDADEFRRSVHEAVEMAGGHCTMTEAKWGWRVGILNLPDVERFTRAVRSLGHRGTISYSAGTGWDWEGER